MKPQQFAEHASRDAAGLPVITLMADPDDGPDTFVSVVDKGANLGRLAVTKRDGASKADVELPAEAPGQDTPSWWQRVFGPLFGMVGWPGMASKGDAPTTFEAAVGVPKLWDTLWTGQDALGTALRGILASEEITDKRTAAEQALAGFSQFVLQEFDRIPTTKAAALEVAELVAKLKSRPTASKAGKVVSTANEKRLRAALEALTEILSAAGLMDGDEPKSTTKAANPATTPAEEPEMNAEMIAKVAEAAAESAVKTAKAANPNITPEALQQVGVEAGQAVFKAAVMGPPQPAMPTDALQQQRSQAGGESGSASDPFGAFTSAINGIGGLKEIASKVDKMHGALFGDDDKDPGLLAVVEAQHKVIKAISGTPQPSNGGGGDEPVPAGDGDRTTTTKAADERKTFGGSGLDLSTHLAK